MKLYNTLLGLSKDERSAEMKRSFNKAVVLTDAKIGLQKDVAKLFVAMIASGDCQAGEMRKHGILITGEDIREKLQDIYGLVNVFQAVIDGAIEITEDEFDKMDSSKLALLSPFLTKDELKDNLGAAVNAAKTGTAKDIRDLKPKEPTKAEKEIAELTAKVAAHDESEKARADAEKDWIKVPIGFVATDIAPGEALVNSKQFRGRLMADFANAIESGNETALLSMMELFGKAYYSACESLGEDPLDFIAEIAAKHATPVDGEVVETPAAIECEAVAA